MFLKNSPVFMTDSVNSVLILKVLEFSKKCLKC